MAGDAATALLLMGAYRPRYADLCRLYTSPELVKWYRHIATATAELREEFDLMFAIGGNPLQFGNRVRGHPDGLLITAANKMRSGTQVRAGFSGTISETVSFDLVSAERNHQTFSEFLEELPHVDETKGRFIWTGVSGSRISTLMSRLETSRDSWKANSKAISEYVANRVADGRLIDWTVVLLVAGRSKVPAKIGPCDVILTDRDNRSVAEPGKYTIGRLVSPVDEATDLSEAEIDRAIAETIAAWEKKSPPKRDLPQAASGPFIRKQRNVEKGLLLIYPINPGTAGGKPLMGFAVSFPFDEDAPLIDYAENSVKQLEDVFA